MNKPGPKKKETAEEVVKPTAVKWSEVVKKLAAMPVSFDNPVTRIVGNISNAPDIYIINECGAYVKVDETVEDVYIIFSTGQKKVL